VEPHLLEKDEINVRGFDCILRGNCTGPIRNSEGALVFAKEEINYRGVPKLNKQHYKNSHCVFVEWVVKDVTLVMVYKSPKFPNSKFFEMLLTYLKRKMPKIAFFGDFNINILAKEGAGLVKIFHDYQLKSSLSPRTSSTDGGSHIDCCFTNISDLTAWFYESYFSYHKPICITWYK